MSENNLMLQDYLPKRERKSLKIKDHKLIDSSLFQEVISEQSSLNITIAYKSQNINLDISSIKRIFSLNMLEYKDYIILNLDNPDLNINSEEHSLTDSLTITHNRKKDKDMNEETTDDGEESTIKEDDLLNEEKNKKDASLTVKKRQDNNAFDPNFPLLHNKIVNTFSSLDKAPQRYLSLIICGNKTIISLDYLKCIYPSIICCGIFNLLYFVNILYTLSEHLNLSFHYFIYIPLALLLIITGFYGYKKVKKNIYDDEFCIILTNICAIAPIFCFALSWIYKNEIAKSQVIINFLINFISCFFSFSCIIILKEAERVKNCEKNIVVYN